MCPGHQISVKLCPWELSRWIVESRKRMTVGDLKIQVSKALRTERLSEITKILVCVIAREDSAKWMASALAVKTELI